MVKNPFNYQIKNDTSAFFITSFYYPLLFGVGSILPSPVFFFFFSVRCCTSKPFIWTWRRIVHLLHP